MIYKIRTFIKLFLKRTRRKMCTKKEQKDLIYRPSAPMQLRLFIGWKLRVNCQCSLIICVRFSRFTHELVQITTVI